MAARSALPNTPIRLMAARSLLKRLGTCRVFSTYSVGSAASLFGLPQRAAVFWALVIASTVGLLAVNWSAAQADTDLAAAALLFIAFTAATETFKVRLRS